METEMWLLSKFFLFGISNFTWSTHSKKTKKFNPLPALNVGSAPTPIFLSSITNDDKLYTPINSARSDLR